MEIAVGSKWQPIKDFENYLVSNNGEVKSIKFGRLLFGTVKSNGYVQIHLRDCGKSKNAHLHRLVAEAFVPNPNDYPQINHVDGNKLNNNANNLEWTTQYLNAKHKIENGLSDRGIAKRTNTSGAVGVTLHKNSWIARIQFDGKRIHLGCYKTKDEAIEAYKQGAIKYHGSTTRLKESV